MTALSLHRLPRLRQGLSQAHRIVRLQAANGSPRAWGRLAAAPVRRLLAGRAPVWLTLGLTFRCQCRCAHCRDRSWTAGPEAELTTDEVKSVLDQAARLGTLVVTLSGGEPLLRDDIVDIVAHAHGLGMLTRLSTNGVGLERDLVRELARAGLTECGVSLDAPDAETHDRSRGLPGTFERALAGMAYARECGVLPEILVHAARQSVPDGLQGIIELARRERAFSVLILFAVTRGAWDDGSDRLLTAQEREQVRALQQLGLVHCEIPSARSGCCVTRMQLIHVSPHGQVTPCPFVPYVMGSVRERPLAEIWRRHVAAFRFDYRGDCFMNDPSARELVAAHARSVAAGLASAETAEER